MSSPRISARWRADREHLGAEALLDGLADLLRQRCLELAPRPRERLDLPRARARARPRTAPASCLPARASASRCLARSSACSSMGARLRWPSDEIATSSTTTLPPELIAQHPAERRDASRLLVYDRATRRGAAPALRRAAGRARADELVVVNDTRVVPARLHCGASGGDGRGAAARARSATGVWEALARPTRRLRAGRAARARSSCSSTLGEGRWRVRLDGEPAGEAPLPPYITEPLADPERYQTVYARRARLGGRADGRAPLHAGAARAARRRARHAPRRPRHVPARSRSTTLDDTSCTASATRSRPEAWERIRGRRARARGRHDDGARARDARPRRAARGPDRRCSSRRASSSGASTRC